MCLEYAEGGVRREGRKVLVWGEVKTGRGSGESKYLCTEEKNEVE
jgi:hypothetical protein